MMTNKLILSSLPKTWIFDVDGTIVIHNGHKNGGDILLAGVKEELSRIPGDDMIIFVTSRKTSEGVVLEAFLNENGIRFDHIIYDAPMGERILINDDKPSGLKMAFAINKKRDEQLNLNFEIDESL